jgi:hypothetical protein
VRKYTDYRIDASHSERVALILTIGHVKTICPIAALSGTDGRPLWVTAPNPTVEVATRWLLPVERSHSTRRPEIGGYVSLPSPYRKVRVFGN